MRIRKDILTSDLFVISLIILLVNDFILKRYFGNWITGKLSDFAGLFIFPLFWSAIFPRFKNGIHLITLIFFVFWKSSLSHDFIFWFNQISIIKVHRIVDYSDFIALISIYFSYRYFGQNKFSIEISPYLVGLIAVFSFCATSVPEPTINFNRPQYVLYKITDKNILSDLTKNYVLTKITDNDFKYRFSREINLNLLNDTLLLVELNGLDIDKYILINDLYDQAIIKQRLASQFLKNISSDYNSRKRQYYSNELIKEIQLIDTFFISTFAFESKLELNFKKSLLTGKFQKINELGGFECGQYNHGVECDTWIYLDKDKNKIKKIKYLNGEIIDIEYYKNDIEMNENSFTRNQLLIVIKISIVIFCILSLLFLGLLIYDYIHYQYAIPIISNPFGIIGISIVFPIPIMIIVIFLQRNFDFLCQELNFGGLGITIMYLFGIFIGLLSFFFAYKPTKYYEIFKYLLFLFFTILAIDQIRFLLKIIEIAKQ